MDECWTGVRLGFGETAASVARPPPILGSMATAAHTAGSASDRALRQSAGVLDRSETGKLALTGAQAKELLNGQVSNDVEALAPGTGCYAALLTNKGKMLGDLRVLDTGDELLLLTERAALVGAGAAAVDEAAAEIVRVESGRPRYGIDADATTIPQEAGLNDRAVSFTKGCYVGQETVARLHWRGKPNRHLRGLRLSAPAPTGTPLRLGEREVGRLGSVAESQALGPIALAIVRREASPGDTLAVGDAGVTAEVVALPFEG